MLINIHFGNGLLAVGTTPLHEPILAIELLIEQISV